MDDAGVVCGGEPVRGLRERIEDRRGFVLVAHPLAQRAPADLLHRDERLGTRAADVEHRHDVAMR